MEHLDPGDDAVLGWHFLRPDRRLGYGDNRLVVAGHTLRVAERPRLFERGLHGSRQLIDAIRYAPSSVVCRVSIGGALDRAEDKVSGQYREVLWVADIGDALWEWLCSSAEARIALGGYSEAECAHVRNCATERRTAVKAGGEIYHEVERARRVAAQLMGTHIAWEGYRLVSSATPLEAAIDFAMRIPVSQRDRKARAASNALIEEEARTLRELRRSEYFRAAPGGSPN